MNTKAKVGSDCSEDYIVIEGSNGFGNMMGALNNIYCGGFLSDTPNAIANQVIRGNLTCTVCVVNIEICLLTKLDDLDCTQPFNICFVTDNTNDATATTIVNGNRGIVSIKVDMSLNEIYTILGFCLEYRQQVC